MNQCLYIIRELGKDEINHLFKAIVRRKIVYGRPVYGACQADLHVNTVQFFLKRCFKRRYSSKRYFPRALEK